MTMTIDTNKIRCASGSDAIVIGKYNNVTVKKRLGYSSTYPAYSSLDIKRNDPTAATGWYWLSLGGTAGQYWIDMDYDGGGWVLVGSHPINVGIPALTYATAAQSTIMSGSSGFVRGSSTPYGYATWVGLNGWDLIASQNGANSNKEVVYFTAASQMSLGNKDSHQRRSRWKWSGWNSNYSWRNANSLLNEVGGTTPGWWSYHIANNPGFSTYDVDQDTSSNNCSSILGSSPFWYVSCWDGTLWGANSSPTSSQFNAPYWTGWTTDYYNYGAVYVR